MPDRKRQILLRFYVDDKEHEIIKEKMKMTKITNLSAYLRKSAIDGAVLVLEQPELLEVAKELNRIGVNINQITKVVNETNSVYKNDIDELSKKVGEMWQLLRSRMSKLT
jgi:Bacterial mobilisation protein (MobC).